MLYIMYKYIYIIYGYSIYHYIPNIYIYILVILFEGFPDVAADFFNLRVFGDILQQSGGTITACNGFSLLTDLWVDILYLLLRVSMVYIHLWIHLCCIVMLNIVYYSFDN